MSGSSGPSMRRLVLLGAVVALLAAAGLGLWRAATAPPPADPQARVEAVAATLRCPTCQNLSVADSPSKIATSMRVIIGEQLAQGRSPVEVRRFFVDRYGEWVLLSPPTSGVAVAVWVLPLLAVAAGGLAALRFARARAAGPDVQVDQEALRRAEQAYAAFTLEVMAASGPRPPGSNASPLLDLPEDEALEAALVSLLSVRTDTPPGQPVDPRAEERALARVAVALEDIQAAEPAAGPPPTPARAAGSGRRLAKGAGGHPRLVWAAGAAGFLALAGLLLAINLAPRGTGQQVTGNLPLSQPQDSEQTIAGYRRELTADPGRTDVRVALAAALLAVDRPGEAARELAQVLTVEPDNPEALLYSGMIAARAGDADIARVALGRFLRVAPDHPAAPMARRLLDQTPSP